MFKIIKPKKLLNTLLQISRNIERRCMSLTEKVPCGSCKQPDRCCNKSFEHVNVPVEMCSKQLASLLKCSHIDAVRYMAENPRLLKVIPAYAIAAQQYFSNEDIAKNGPIVTLKPSRIYERIQILKEIGIVSVTADKVVRFASLMAIPLKELIKCEIMFDLDDIIKNMCNELNAPDEIKSSAYEKLYVNYVVSDSAEDVRTVIIQDYLSWRLEHRLVYVKRFERANITCLLRSCSTIKRVLDVLIDHCHMPKEKILPSNLLTINPDVVEDILRQVPTLGGIDIKLCASRFPQILYLTPEKLLAMDEIIEQNVANVNQINICAIDKCLTGDADGGSNKKNAKFILYLIRFISSYRQTMQNMKFLQEQEENHSLQLFLQSSKALEKSEMGIFSSFIWSMDICTYLALMCDKSETEVKGKLSRHTNSFVTIDCVKKIAEFLFLNNITREQLWYGLNIVSYPLHAIEKYFHELPSYEELQPFEEWRNHYNFLQLILYYIEKDNGFSMENINIGKSETSILKEFFEDP